MPRNTYPEFDFGSGAFVSRLAAQRVVNELIDDYLLKRVSMKIERSGPREFRIYFPLLRRYFWPEKPAMWQSELQAITKEHRFD
jgi:hypothetical protein